jgi:hypothetical protein
MGLRGLGLACALAALASACTPLGLNTASRNFTREASATPDVLGAFEGDAPVATAADWTGRRAPLLRAAFEREVYGPVPMELDGFEISRRVVDENFAGGAGILEEIDVRAGLPGSSPGADAPSFRIALALPKNASPQHRVPLILGANFCGNQVTFASMQLSPPAMGGCGDGKGFEASLVRLIFGVYISTGPNAEILNRGYAYATFYATEFAPDDAQAAGEGLARIAAALGPAHADRAPNGVIAAWAAGFSWAVDVLDRDPRLDPRRTTIYGHSRDGKAALVAAAWDPRIDAVMAHQAGKGGSTLTRAYAGESVKQITHTYPHWFSPAYARFADNEAAAPIDQHALIALIAPRPVMLGNGWNDVWSDPNGAYRAAVGATPVYRLFGARGLAQTGLDDEDPAHRGEIDWWIRPYAHGVRKADWEHFLAFLDQWMGDPPAARAAPQANR